MLDGELSIRCGGDTFDAAAGSFVFLPRGRPHRFSAKGQPGRLLLIVVPGGIWYSDEMRSLVAGALRFAGALLLRALNDTPRRQLNLARWTRGREFRHLHGLSVAWLDSHFELIEYGAPWLHRVGSDVWDFCKGGVQPFFRLSPGFSATASGIREVTAVYGFDGPLTPRLRSLDQAIPPAGWELGTRALPQTWTDLDPGRAAAAEGLARHRTRWMSDRRVNLRWWPSAASDYPSDGEGTPPWGRPPLMPCMRVSWSSRGQETGWGLEPNKTRGATRGYLPLEVSESHVPELLEQALARSLRARAHGDHKPLVLREPECASVPAPGATVYSPDPAWALAWTGGVRSGVSAGAAIASNSSTATRSQMPSTRPMSCSISFIDWSWPTSSAGRRRVRRSPGVAAGSSRQSRRGKGRHTCSASPASRRSPAPCRPSGTTGPAYSATYRYEIQISNDFADPVQSEQDASCRGTIGGRDWQRPELQRRYGNYLATYLLQR